MIPKRHYHIFWISHLRPQKLSDVVQEKTVRIEGVFLNEQEEIITSLQNSYFYFSFLQGNAHNFCVAREAGRQFM